MSAKAELLAGDRLHLQHGPINIVAKAYGPNLAVRSAYMHASQRFSGLLDSLVKDLPMLKSQLSLDGPKPSSETARRMTDAIRPYHSHWITPMAAVAGAVADTVTEVMAQESELERLFVNNGGDIAIMLRPGQTIAIGIVPTLDRGSPEATLRIHHEDPVRGIATSGWNGHSFSMGIADAVTVLAKSAAAADAAATLIANETNAEHPRIRREQAARLDPNSDLGFRDVTTLVPDNLPESVVEQALNAGERFANQLLSQGHIVAAHLRLQNRRRHVGPIAAIANNRS